MRKLGLRHSLTAQLYQQGKDWPTAYKAGANFEFWCVLEERYQGGSIPQSDWLGSHPFNAPQLAHTASGYSY